MPQFDFTYFMDDGFFFILIVVTILYPLYIYLLIDIIGTVKIINKFHKLATYEMQNNLLLHSLITMPRVQYNRTPDRLRYDYTLLVTDRTDVNLIHCPNSVSEYNYIESYKDRTVIDGSRLIKDAQERARIRFMFRYPRFHHLVSPRPFFIVNRPSWRKKHFPSEFLEPGQFPMEYYNSNLKNFPKTRIRPRKPPSYFKDL